MGQSTIYYRRIVNDFVYFTYRYVTGINFWINFSINEKFKKVDSTLTVTNVYLVYARYSYACLFIYFVFWIDGDWYNIDIVCSGVSRSRFKERCLYCRNQ